MKAFERLNEDLKDLHGMFGYETIHTAIEHVFSNSLCVQDVCTKELYIFNEVRVYVLEAFYRLEQEYTAKDSEDMPF